MDRESGKPPIKRTTPVEPPVRKSPVEAPGKKKVPPLTGQSQAEPQADVAFCVQNGPVIRAERGGAKRRSRFPAWLITLVAVGMTGVLAVGALLAGHFWLGSEKSRKLAPSADQRVGELASLESRVAETEKTAGKMAPQPSQGPEPAAPPTETLPKDSEPLPKPRPPAESDSPDPAETIKNLPRDPAIEPKPAPIVDPPQKPAPPVAPKAAESDDAEGDQALLTLYQGKKLCSKNEYPTLRRIYARRFEQKHQAQIKQAFGSDEKMTAWLDAHAAIKEELFTAIDEKYDKLPAVLKIFQELVEKFPNEVPSYAELAIATAVTWDDERGGGVYDYGRYQIRTKATMPDGALGAIDNFQYFLAAEKFMQGRARFLPWEFLVHMINHRTPAVERQWALAGYLPFRVNFGRCYKDVPYDHEMLNSNFRTAKLSDKPYTLENLRLFGGVCAMQADFASRVGKSIGVPAEFVGGEAAGGERHAWVMWVELKNVSKDAVVFSLESFGRYRGDKYYVGYLRDPHTGRQITDRQLELRLHTVGMGAQAKRHAALVMKAYPMLQEKLAMDVNEQLAFLNQVVQYCPGNEECWLAAARLSKDGLVERQHVNRMTTILNRLFVVFAAFPDFTWVVFDDLISFQKSPKARSELYGRLVTLYEAAGRPDLACEARLKFSDYLLAEGRQKEVIAGLAFTIKKFPDEGRYVPKMLDKLEAVCKEIKGADQNLIRFYQEFLPLVPRMRDDRPSPYCMSMYGRAATRFRELGQEPLAQMCEAQLAQLKAMLPKSKP